MKKAKRMELPREVWMGPGVTKKIPKICKTLSLDHSARLIADKKTYEIAGAQIENSLSEAGIETHLFIISEANLKTVKKVKESSKDSDFLLGIGGGACIDVAKFTSFKQGIPYLSNPTAASHDGISSSRASIRGGGKATSVQAQAPTAIIADTEIIRDAPYRLMASGCGDIIANYTAVLDWKLARDEKKESYSEYAAALSKMSAKLVAENAKIIGKKTEKSARKIVKALISSGVAMSIAGSSRPASGAEHLFSHVLDRIAPKPALHGEQCAVGSIMMMKLHGKNWKSTREALKKVKCPTNSEELDVEKRYIIEALTEAHKIRPKRYTILKGGLTEEEAEKLAKETKVI